MPNVNRIRSHPRRMMDRLSRLDKDSSQAPTVTAIPTGQANAGKTIAPRSSGLGTPNVASSIAALAAAQFDAHHNPFRPLPAPGTIRGQTMDFLKSVLNSINFDASDVELFKPSVMILESLQSRATSLTVMEVMSTIERETENFAERQKNLCRSASRRAVAAHGNIFSTSNLIYLRKRCDSRVSTAKINIKRKCHADFNYVLLDSTIAAYKALADRTITVGAAHPFSTLYPAQVLM